MSRRSGQSGSIQKEGNWYVVRYWKDVAGQEKRQRVYERICPISGPGKLSASERERKAKEIIAASGVDTQEYFDRVVKQSGPGVTFRQQADSWLEDMRNRDSDPLAPSTIATWGYALDKWIKPNIGDMPLESVNVVAMKDLVAKMVKGGLSPKSVGNYSQIVKMVVASATDEQGEELYPRKWNNRLIRMPKVNKKKQRTPSFTGEVVTGIIQRTEEEKYRVLFALLASSGLRFGEALGIDIKNISSDCSNIKIVEKAWGSEVQDRLKTESGEREIDLHSSMAKMLRDYMEKRTHESGQARPTCCLPHATANRFTSRASCGASCTRSWAPSANRSAASMRSVVFATRTCETSRRPLQVSCSSGWVIPERACPTSTTRSNRTWRFAKKWQRRPVWVSNFRPKSSLLDGMDGNSNLRAIWK
jgi:integrase